MNTKTTLLNNLSERLNYALNLTGIKKADLARAINVKPQVIQFLCTSQTQSSKFTFEIATALGLNTRWLATGEGEMYVADDPRQQLLKNYKSIPLLNNYDIREVFLHGNYPESNRIKEWLPLKTEDQDTFAIQITDASMETNFPIGSHVFIRRCSKENLSNHKFVFVYLKKFDTFIVRELIETGSTKILSPGNKELFREISITDDVNFLGVVTDCFWHIRN